MEWLGITEDQIHVTNSGRDTDLTGRCFKVCNPLHKLQPTCSDIDPWSILRQSVCIYTHLLADITRAMNE